MSSDRPGLLMTLPARPENVVIVRHALAGLAERLGMREPGIGDLKTVVTEACMNVAVHAYDDVAGPLQVEAQPEPGGLTVRIRDFGTGIRPRPDVERPSLRIGLALIAALSSSFGISGGLGRGTEITMHIPLDSAAENGSGSNGARDLASEEVTELTIDSAELVAPALERVVGALAARQGVSLDQLGDTLLFTDAVARGAPKAFGDGHFHFTVADRPEGIDLRIGPMPAGATERLRDELSLPEVDGSSLESLADELRVEEDSEGEYLVARFVVPG